MKINDVYLGDCLELMKEIPDKSVDMILADLPYGTTQNNWDSVINLGALWKQYLRIIKDRRAVVLTSQHKFTAKLILSCERYFRYKLVWIKSKATNFLNAKVQPLRKHEDICIFYKKHPTYNPQMWDAEPYYKYRKNSQTDSYDKFDPIAVESKGERYPTDVFYFKTAESEGNVVHSTQKPVALFEYLIRTYTNEGDLILDNVAGSGTTGVACQNLDRDFILMEKDEKYFNIIKERLGL